MRYGMIIDLDRCIGCHACSIACKVENGTTAGIFWNRVFQVEKGKFPDVKRMYLPRICMHCEYPACVEACPTGATYKSEKGFVLVDETICIGCKACMVACPYDVRYYNDGKCYFENCDAPWSQNQDPHREGTVNKCCFCNHLVENGEEPACVAACPTDARIFGDLDNPDSEIHRLSKNRESLVQLHSSYGLEPSVCYLTPKGYKFQEPKQLGTSENSEGTKNDF